MILILATILILAGLYLAIGGLRPRRRGDTPYCRGCAYNLTGIPLEPPYARCPECGAYVGEPAAIVVGERRVRRGRAATGGFLLVLGLASFGGVLAGHLKLVDWYTYKPTRWVLADLRSSTPATAVRAADELQRRFIANRLSARGLRKLAEICLAEQVRSEPNRQVHKRILALLGRLYTRESLSERQVERMFKQGLHAELRVRPTVVLGELVPYRVRWEERAPVEACARYEIKSMMLDDHELKSGGLVEVQGTALLSPVGSPFSTGSSFACTDLGTHVLSMTAHYGVATGVEQPWDGFTPQWDFQLDLRAAFEVVSAEGGPPVRMRRSDTLDQWILDEITLCKLSLYKSDLSEPERNELELDGWFCIGPGPPIGLVFDCHAEWQGRRIPLGIITVPARPNSDNGWSVHVNDEWAADIAPETLDIVLTPNPALAKGSVDIFEIWGGTLRFEDVIVHLKDDKGRLRPPSPKAVRPRLVEDE